MTDELHDELSAEDADYLAKCRQLYKIFSNENITSLLSELRDYSITRASKLDNEKLVWKELGKVELVQLLLNKQNSLFNEIKRIENYR